MTTLPDAAVALMVQCLNVRELGRLMCVSRDMQSQLLRVLASHPVQVTVDCSNRSWRASLQAVGDWCRCITRLALLKGSSARSLYSLQLLQPLLTQPHLTHLTLQGFKLNQQGDCHARHLVAMLVQHCPLLEHLDLQECDLPHLGTFQPLIQQHQRATPLISHQPAGPLSPQPCSRQAGLQTGLRVLQLTGARLAPSIEPLLRFEEKQPLTGTGTTASTVISDTVSRQHDSSSSSSVLGCGSATAQAAAAGGQSVCTGQGGAGCVAPASEGCGGGGVTELHLGCGCDQADAAWLRLNGSISSRDVITLLTKGGGCQALRVLNVSKRPAINDDLLLQLAQAAQPPSSLDTLDVSLTRVTPSGLLQLLPHCPWLRVLRYACRSGDDGLDAELLSALGAAAPGLQEIDLSLHPHLDDAGLAALAQQCRKLKKVKVARSHKITGLGMERFAAALPQLQQLVVVRCRGVSQASLARLTASLPQLQLLQGECPVRSDADARAPSRVEC